MKLQFLGTTGCIPDKNDDSPSYVLNNKYCFDSGWALATNLLKYDHKPTDIEYLFFTHMHQDHYLSLPTILFYYLQTGVSLDKLTIYGPKNEVEPVVKRAMDFVRYPIKRGYPNVIGLTSGDIFEIDDIKIEVLDSLHTVSGLCYKVTEKLTGKTFGTTGDTTYKKEYGDFFKNCDALVHETTLCVCKEKDEGAIACRHSSIYDAVSTANEAHVKTLFIMHGHRSAEEETIREGEKLFKGKIIWPVIGEEYII